MQQAFRPPQGRRQPKPVLPARTRVHGLADAVVQLAALAVLQHHVHVGVVLVNILQRLRVGEGMALQVGRHSQSTPQWRHLGALLADAFQQPDSSGGAAEHRARCTACMHPPSFTATPALLSRITPALVLTWPHGATACIRTQVPSDGNKQCTHRHVQAAAQATQHIHLALDGLGMARPLAAIQVREGRDASGRRLCNVHVSAINCSCTCWQAEEVGSQAAGADGVSKPLRLPKLGSYIRRFPATPSAPTLHAHNRSSTPRPALRLTSQTAWGPPGPLGWT